MSALAAAVHSLFQRTPSSLAGWWGRGLGVWPGRGGGARWRERGIVGLPLARRIPRGPTPQAGSLDWGGKFKGEGVAINPALDNETFVCGFSK